MQTDRPHSIELLKETFSTFNETSERLRDAYQGLESQIVTVLSEIEERGTLEREMRLQSMGRMVTKIIHDIRNPLGSIELLSSLLRRELNNDTDKQRLIDHLIFGVKNIDNILSNLLHFTHFPKPKFKIVSIKNMIEKCIEILVYIIENNHITIIQDVPPEIEASCDESLMKQVFINLFLNSIQAMAPGGCLSIKVIKKKDSADIEILIEDNGSGIDPKNLNRIFDPFFTTREKGTGLGLTIVHNIIKVHGGGIKVYSKSGEGSLFIVKLPQKREQDYESSNTSGR